MDSKLHTITGSARFRQCTMCQYEWATREDFLQEPSLTTIGYQVNFDELEEGIFLFNHSCGTTLGIPAHVFKDLYDGPIYATRATGTEECPEYCLRQHELRPCPVECECAYVREILQLVT